MTLTDATDK